MSPKLGSNRYCFNYTTTYGKKPGIFELHAVTASGSATVGKATALQGLFATHVVIKSGGLGDCPYPAL
jgi:hypothetical protein